MTEENTKQELNTPPERPEQAPLDLGAIKEALLPEVHEIINKAVGNRYKKTDQSMAELKDQITQQIQAIPEMLGAKPAANTEPPTDGGQAQEAPIDSAIAKQLKDVKRQQEQQFQALKDQLAEAEHRASAERQSRLELQANNAFCNAIADKINPDVLKPDQILTLLKKEGAKLAEDGRYVVTTADQYGDPQNVPLIDMVDSILDANPLWKAQRPGVGTGSSNGNGSSPARSSAISNPNALAAIGKSEGVDGIINNLIKSASS